MYTESNCFTAWTIQVDIAKAFAQVNQSIRRRVSEEVPITRLQLLSTMAKAFCYTSSECEPADPDM